MQEIIIATIAKQHHRPTMMDPPGSIPSVISRSSKSSITPIHNPTVKSWRGANIKLPFNPDLHSTSRHNQPHSPTDASSSSVEAAAYHHVGGGATIFTANLDSTLLNLPLYDEEMYKAYGHDSYVCAEKRGDVLSEVNYMPPAHFWSNNARAIRREVLTDDLVRVHCYRFCWG